MFNFALFIAYLFAVYKKGKRTNKVVMSSVCLIFVLSSAHLVCYLSTASESRTIAGFLTSVRDRSVQFGKCTSPLGNFRGRTYGAASARS